MWDDFIPLTPGVKHYPWGQRARNGAKPFIAELIGADAPSDTPFAELWIGAHPGMPAQAHLPDGSERPLDALLAESPRDLLGERVLKNGWTSLPFLLKVLAAEQPLSIQAHPDKQLAELLHARDPEHYPDSNHKPEIAIGLLGLDALSQFRPATDISADVRRLPPLQRFLACVEAPPEAPDARRSWLRDLYAKVMRTNAATCTAAICELRAFIEHMPEHEIRPNDRWFLRLSNMWPEDRGVFSVYFLNLIHLDPGQAVFLGPDEPHAYLNGVIIECMANSDNVVRAGLTPKFTDTDVLLDMLTYTDRPPEVTAGRIVAPGIRLYAPPVPEFRVEWRSGDGLQEQELPADGLPAVLLVLRGSVTLVSERCPGGVRAERGTCWFLPACRGNAALRFEGAGEVVLAAPNPTQRGN